MFPGHGGFLDRFDCMCVMFPFVHVYIQEIVKGRMNSFTSVMFYFMRLSRQDQVELLGRLTAFMNQGADAVAH